MIDIVDGGLPEHWPITKDYIETIYYVTKQINARFPRDNNLLISSQWEWMMPPDKNLDSPRYKKEYDNVFILSTLDPVPRERIEAYEAKGKNIYYIGNTTGRGYFSFWSINTKNFKQYTDDEISPVGFKNRILSYNRNPHEHRLKIVNEMLKRGIDKHGVITLGDHFYTHNPDGKYPLAHKAAPMLAENPESDKYLETGETEALHESQIPHDTYTLGNLEIWQNSFLVVVTEATVDSNVFISEKVFKPMIGKRPFIVLGDVGIHDHLVSCGFKTFGKYFDMDDSIDRMPSYSMEKYVALCDVIEKVSKMSEDEMHALYQEMLPDIEHNYNNVTWFREHNQLKIQNKGLFKI